MKKFCLLFIFAMLFMVIGCEKNSDEPSGAESELATYNTAEWGSFSTDSGYGLQLIAGTVPQNDNGESASISFTIETPVDAPKPMSSDGEFVGDLVRFGPEAFNFRWPVEMAIPYPEDVSPDELFVVYYDQLNEEWQIIPKSGVDGSKRTINFHSINLGIYGLVTFPSFFRDEPPYDGGFEFYGDNTYYYTLTVATVTNYKFPYQANWPGNPAIGRTASSGMQSTTGTPITPLHMYLVQATYQIWISRTLPGTFSTLPTVQTYSIPASGTLNNAVTCGQLGSCTGWTSLSLPGGGTWEDGTPEYWPVPTVTFGTGEFQATLNWVNNDQHATDLDLHLYGPDDMHVYYWNKISSNGAFSLDRDWLQGFGNATENIYSLTNIPSGSYTLKVQLYSGDPVNFTVRVIRSGRSPKTYNHHISEGEIEIETFSK